jgi:hypothetical protein
MDDDSDALRRQFTRHPGANSGAAAGDQGTLARKEKVHECRFFGSLSRISPTRTAERPQAAITG